LLLPLNWRVEAHSSNPDRGISANGYRGQEFPNNGEPETSNQHLLKQTGTQLYKSNGRIESIYVVDMHGSVFRGGHIGATSPCL
jgi:hypothetical protein